MGHTVLCVLGLFLLNTLLSGQDDGDYSTDPILESPAFTLFEEDSVILRCKNHASSNEKKATFFKDGSPVKMDSNHHSLPGAELIIYSVSVSDRGNYTCSFEEGAESKPKELRVKERRRNVELRAEETIIPVGGRVTLTCSVEDPAGMEYEYEFRRTSDAPEKPSAQTEKDKNKVDIPDGGKYICRGGSREQYFFTPISNDVTIQETVPNKAVVTFQPDWPQIFSGEKITLRCEIQGGGDTDWTYEWRTTSSHIVPTGKEYISSAEYPSGEYRCMGRSDYFLTKWSEAITVSAYKPRAKLTAVNRDIPVGGSVTLTCSVNTAPSSSSSSSSSSGWKYFWYRGEKTSLTTQDGVLYSNRQISVSVGGVYRCRGGRGEPDYYTDYSDSITVNKNVANKAVVSLQPNWSEIYEGEKLTLRCEITDEGDSGWEYEWRTTSSIKPSNQNEHHIRFAYASHSGTYSCKGRMKSAQQSSTEWSDPITLTVSNKPVLSVSPSWLSPGASVTLSCSVKDPSAGWRFYWYKAVPRLSDISYSYDLLPGSTNGTEQDSYIVDGQTHTAGYVCGAARGDPVIYTHYSELKFVWSGEFDLSASLTVSPDRVQHFTSESVSLSCEGNSTEWRVKSLPENSYWPYCSSWGTMTRSTCTIQRYRLSAAVFWCEFGSGEFSNAVNITIQNEDIILVSPVRPVTEGDFVTLSCKSRRQQHSGKSLNVFFYRNGEVIQNDTRRELNISAVLKSDEGLYKCQHSGTESTQSWMSVKVSRPESSSFPVLMIIGLVCGIILVILLLLLCRFRLSKDSCFNRPIQTESTNRGSATSDMVNQNEDQLNQYSTLLHGAAESQDATYSLPALKNIGKKDAAESQDVTYSLLELKNIGKKRKQHNPEESCVYSDVNIGTPDDSLMYAQVNCHNKAKVKKKKGKSTPSATD